MTFQQINQILEVTDDLEMSREWVEIPLGTESPGIVRNYRTGKVEIIVDAEIPFEVWLSSLRDRILQVMGDSNKVMVSVNE